MKVALALSVPTVIVPLLGTLAGLLLTENEIVALDTPLVADVMLIQTALLTTDHLQPACVLRLKLLFPPLDWMLKFGGETENVQLDCVRTLNVCVSALESAVRTYGLLVEPR